jgi:hypothetical protein
MKREGGLAQGRIFDPEGGNRAKKDWPGTVFSPITPTSEDRKVK